MLKQSDALPAPTGNRVPLEAIRPGPHPEPPIDLAQRPLPLLSTDRIWFRVYRLQHEPLYFSRSGNNRFDSPAGEYGVLYLGQDEHYAFVGTFGHATGVRFVTMTALRARGLVRVEVRRPLRLVDLTGPGLAHLGADERLCAGDYDVPSAGRWRCNDIRSARMDSAIVPGTIPRGYARRFTIV